MCGEAASIPPLPVTDKGGHSVAQIPSTCVMVPILGGSTGACLLGAGGS